MDHDLAAGCHDVIQRRLGVVVPFKGDAGALQRIGYGAVHQLDRVLLPVGGDADGECALDIQGCKIAAERGVVDLIALFRADAGKVHDLCGGSSGIGHKNLPRTIGVGDVGQPQICSGDPEFFTLFIIRRTLKDQERWLIYRRNELISHELCHVARV